DHIRHTSHAATLVKTRRNIPTAAPQRRSPRRKITKPKVRKSSGLDEASYVRDPAYVPRSSVTRLHVAAQACTRRHS
ncbi:MAG: hypothetical protein ACRDQ1_02180, partial [Sciscionella sp.]